ncbi:MAG TPA: hypothetical protein VGB85_10375, partial [Nannocystis sp.]
MSISSPSFSPSPSSGPRRVLLPALFVLLAACSGAQQTGHHDAPTPDTPATPEVDKAPPASEPGAPPAPVLPKVSHREHPAGQAWVFEAGAEPRKQE